MDEFGIVKVGKLNHFSFNADATAVTIGTRMGFAVFNSDPIQQRLRENGDGMKIVELLYCTSLLCIVPSGDKPGSSPRKLKLWNSVTKETIVETLFQSTISSCRLNKRHLVICLEIPQIHIYELSTMQCLQVLSVSLNNKGLIALSREDTSYIAFPGLAGDVILFDCVNLKILAQWSAHKSDLAQIAFNNTGNRLATASSTGTVIRVFNAPSGELLYSFRRGIHHVVINSLSFCANSQFLSAGSATGTVHIFLIPGSYTPPSPPQKKPEGATTRAAGNSSSSGGGSAVQAPSPPEADEACVADGDDAASKRTWGEALGSFRSKALTTLTAAASIAVEYAATLKVLPGDAQEFAESLRAVCLCKVPAGEAEFKAAMTISATPSGLAHKCVVVTQTGNLYRFAVPSIEEIAAKTREVLAQAPVVLTGAMSPGSSAQGSGINPQDPLLCAMEDEAALLDEES